MQKWLDENYYLRTVNIFDANDIFEFASDPDVTRSLTWKTHKVIEETTWVINELYLKKENVPSSYAIVDNAKNKVIGIIDFNSSDPKMSNYYQIGYFMNKKYWNQGIMTKALKVLINIGFNELGLEVIAITHEDRNIGSKKVILKNNFKYIKTFENIYFPLVDRHRDVLYYEIRKKDIYE